MEITLHGWRAIGTCRRASSKEKKEKKRDNSTNLTNLWTFLWKQTTKALNPPPPQKKSCSSKCFRYLDAIPPTPAALILLFAFTKGSTCAKIRTDFNIEPEVTFLCCQWHLSILYQNFWHIQKVFSWRAELILIWSDYACSYCVSLLVEAVAKNKQTKQNKKEKFFCGLCQYISASKTQDGIIR